LFFAANYKNKAVGEKQLFEYSSAELSQDRVPAAKLSFTETTFA